MSFIMAEEPKVIRSAFSKTDPVGSAVGGLVLSQELTQQVDPKTKKPRTDRNGHPMMQLEVVILTNEQTDPEDDGRRMLYVRGNMRRAIRAAVIAAGADDLRNGAQLAVMYTGQGKAIGDYAAPKLYKAKYEPPTEASLAEVAAFVCQDGDE